MYSGEFIDWVMGQKKVSATLSYSSLKTEFQYAQIYCNDCKFTNMTLYHYVGLEYVKCGSFNTKKI